MTEIGAPLLQTTIEIDKNGFIIIGGNRKCFLNFNFNIENNICQTEDVAIQQQNFKLNNISKIFVRGRKVINLIIIYFFLLFFNKFFVLF